MLRGECGVTYTHVVAALPPFVSKNFQSTRRVCCSVGTLVLCPRSYCRGHTGSLPNTEVKRGQVRSVPGSETAWEHRMTRAYIFYFIFFLPLYLI